MTQQTDRRAPLAGDAHPKNWTEIRVFRALLTAQNAMVTKHRRLFAELGITMPEFDLLAVLGNTDGKRMKDVAAKLVTSPSNVTRLSVALEKRGLLERRRSEVSDREVVARLTPEGQALFDDIFLNRLFNNRLSRLVRDDRATGPSGTRKAECGDGKRCEQS